MGSRTFTAARRRITALRLSALGIAAPIATRPGDAVRHLLALQAQDYPGALWSIGLRMPAATRADVEAAHERGDFVRTWPFRGTLHFLAPEDVGWILGLTGERMIASAAGRYRQLELTQRDLDRAGDIARHRLSGTHLNRADLLAAFEAGGVGVAGQRGAHLLGHLAQSGLTVLRGQNAWHLSDDVIREPRHLERDDALRELALRYVAARGPVTDRDFAWWSSLTLTDARAGIAAAQDELERVEIEDITYWLRPGLEPAADGIHVLPGFDEYLLGYSDRHAPLAGAHSSTIVPGGNGLFLATIVVNGEVVGSWRRTVSSGKDQRVDVVAEPFGRLSAATRKGFERAARRYAAFLELPIRFTELPATDKNR
jgi:hypothetical protein